MGYCDVVLVIAFQQTLLSLSLYVWFSGMSSTKTWRVGAQAHACAAAATAAAGCVGVGVGVGHMTSGSRMQGRGSVPVTILTVSFGSSARMVPTPTMIQSCIARSA